MSNRRLILIVMTLSSGSAWKRMVMMNQFRLGNDVIQYTYDMTPNEIIQGHAQLQQVLDQYQGLIREVYTFVEEAMKYALTC